MNVDLADTEIFTGDLSTDLVPSDDGLLYCRCGTVVGEADAPRWKPGVGGLIYSGLGLEQDNKISHVVNNQNFFKGGNWGKGWGR